ncbi:metallophosphoesterase [Gilliamella sp. B2776]|uniref:metallophosphoesterase n=1 Tax=unclassified Gilliamella TaxID=2685620 RepID=UPI00226A86ED|nr:MULTISPECIES: metallophosphoesterase [unclassified Gilliamella]MCX8650836.1 metallophosphoesterase [Gilliamella sp. B2779]MCX8653984.1 metallophosphoesterase [Gilliamella sp. B2737]MCX8657252.1 metallophosphoesterase [Gilliamella sp. B2894]MCX8691463.1 metallophosphoesterase [Gilliamella sp. B2776]MCX8693548.1 metallophosphoesterase [Gilliamella sp. B2881]
MTIADLIAISIAIIMCGSMAVYLGKRWQFWFNFSLTSYYQMAYWTVVVMVGLSLVLSRLSESISTYWLPLILNAVSAIMICCLLVTILFDIGRWISKKKLKPQLTTKFVYFIAVFSLCYYGHEMAIEPSIVNYQVKIDKKAKVNKLRIVQLSDIHINDMTFPDRIQQMVDKVNQLNADFIVITGDTLDRQLKPFVDKGFNKQFQRFESKYGTYIIFGNHEYLNIKHESNHEQDIINAYEQANMKVLKDDVVYLEEVGITFIGRDDFSSSRYDIKRASLSDLIMFADTNKPIILLDHQPHDLNEPANLGVDLMISGHTHAGQIFPINLIEKLIYQNSYGIYKNIKQNFTSIVSSGFGFWGPPIRLMTRSEIVEIEVIFDKKSTQLINFSQ